MTLYVFDNPNLTNTPTNLLDKQTQQNLKKLHQKGLIKTIPHKSTTTLKTINTNTYTGLTQQTTPYNPLPTNKPNGHTAISLFAGAGGSALGLEKAGYTIHQCYELDKTATTTLTKNRPTWNTTPTDITTTNFTHLHHTIDLIEGGFPCQPFSHAGNREGLNDTRGTLFHHYLRAVHETEPKAFIAENVPGLLTNDKGNTWKTIHHAFTQPTPTGATYTIHHKVLRSHWLGIPQKRDRLIIVGIRNDQRNPEGFEFPVEQEHVVTLRTALQGVPDSPGVSYSDAKYEIMRQVPEGGNWKDLPKELQVMLTNGKGGVDGSYSGTAKRLAWDEPSLTILASPAQRRTERCHPEHTRPLTVREAARVQTFPDDWEFAGGVTAQYRQVGNAVPPRLAYLVGKQVEKHLM